jgi:hypothetical protein
MRIRGGRQTVVLVSCVGKKLSRPAEAGELYQSPWFKKARAFAEHAGDRWFILSAEHGLLGPDWIVAPYDTTLKTMPRAERKQWASSVMATLLNVLRPRDRVVILAGIAYREFLEPSLRSRGYVVEVPMRGLGIGRQLAWLSNNTITSQERN